MTSDEASSFADRDTHRLAIGPVGRGAECEVHILIEGPDQTAVTVEQNHNAQIDRVRSSE